ncbi:MAG TPA: LPS export ABC transporter permease LptG [Anaerolineae bacterium]|nr:LPS export ABC transporter permease LptG [Anaerolineae bacterium]
MPIIYKYLTREILKYFAIILIMVVGIYVAVDFFEKVDNFMEAGLSLSKTFSYLILKIPFIVAQIIPLSILLAVLIVFGLMTKNNELVALKSSGISTYYFLTPVILLGIIFSAFLFFLSEVIVPVSMEHANKIWLKDVRKESAVISKEKDIWIKGNCTITHIKHYNSANSAIFGVTINYFDVDFRLIRRVDAKKGVFIQNRWCLYDVAQQNLNKKDNNYKISFHEKIIEKLDFMPDDLMRVIKKSEDMSFKELISYIRKIEAEGYDATSYRVDLYAKTAFPFVCIIMCMMGTGIAVRGKIKEGLPLIIALGIGIAFLYWISYSFCISLGYGEMLPPVIAAWAANLIFLCFGALILLNSD